MPRRKKVAELDGILEKIPPEKKYIGEKLVDELVFMQGTLADLKRQIKAGGVVEHFENGKQSFDRESPALKSYNTMVQRYGSLYKQLSDLIPKKQEKEPESKVLEFLKGGGKQ